MTLKHLAEQTKLPQEYLIYLKAILDGSEADYTQEDLEAALELADDLRE